MSSEEKNLTGIWLGLFSYSRRYRAGNFTATLIDTGKRLGGSTSELGMLGQRDGETIFATLSGFHDGRLVRFTKQYEGPLKPNHAVEYEGNLTPDFTEIEGRWFIPGNWAGRFLMIRSGGRAIETTREVFEKAN